MFQFFRKNTGKSVNVNELEGLLGKIDLIDIREPYEYKSGHVPTAKNIPMNQLLSQTDKYLDTSKEYYIICQSGGRSSSACSVLGGMGYNIVNVVGGTGFYNGKLER